MMSQTSASRRPSAGACLDDLLATRFLPRRWSNRIWCAWQLSAALAQRTRNLARNAEWRAYGDDGQILFAIARTHHHAVPVDSTAAIDVYFLDDKASVYSAGVWEYNEHHGWWLDAVLELSYDCEHGWWFDGLIETSTANDSVVLPAPPPAARSIVPLAARNSRPRKNT